MVNSCLGILGAKLHTYIQQFRIQAKNLIIIPSKELFFHARSGFGCIYIYIFIYTDLHTLSLLLYMGPQLNIWITLWCQL